MADISKITVIKQGTPNVYNLKDATLRQSLLELPCVFFNEQPQYSKTGDICFEMNINDTEN